MNRFLPLTLGACVLLAACASVVAAPKGSEPPIAVERGTASWYGKRFHGRITASGERFDMYALTAAHKTLPMHSLVEVRNLRNGKRVVVRINDRGPFRNRTIDLSYAAARQLGMIERGLAPVELRVLERPD